MDREELAGPFRKEVWDYNIAIAKAASRSDEIQFDYMRFPTDGKLSVPSIRNRITWKTASRPLTVF
jgi:hypothetical protein